MSKITKILGFVCVALLFLIGFVIAGTIGKTDGHFVPILLAGVLAISLIFLGYLADTNNRVIGRLIKENEQRIMRLKELERIDLELLNPGANLVDVHEHQKRFIQNENEIKELRSKISKTVREIEKRSSIQPFL